MQRGALTKNKNSRLIGLWMTDSLDEAINEAVRISDLDRSKFIRGAIRDRLRALKIKLPEDA